MFCPLLTFLVSYLTLPYLILPHPTLSPFVDMPHPDMQASDIASLTISAVTVDFCNLDGCDCMRWLCCVVIVLLAGFHEKYTLSFGKSRRWEMGQR